MKQFKDPFEAAFKEHEDSPPDSPFVPDKTEPPDSPAALLSAKEQEDDDSNSPKQIASNTVSVLERTVSVPAGKAKEEDEEEEEDNIDVKLEKFPSTGDPDNVARMQQIISQFDEPQMNRYESFRRSGFQKTNMKRLLASITGSQKISIQMTIVVSGIAKIFVGELVETARMVMTERKESGPIRPCHIREAYRRLKLEGKVPRRSVRRLFR